MTSASQEIFTAMPSEGIEFADAPKALHSASNLKRHATSCEPVRLPPLSVW